MALHLFVRSYFYTYYIFSVLILYRVLAAGTHVSMYCCMLIRKFVMTICMYIVHFESNNDDVYTQDD